MKLLHNNIPTPKSSNKGQTINIKMVMPFIVFLIISIFSLQELQAQSQSQPFVVVIDPGHGGKDHGAIRGNYREKNINLGVALKLGNQIKQYLPSVKVIYTRSTDVFVELHRRAEIANKAKADLFISIHTNSTASKQTKATGAETYILGTARSKESLEVAKRENSVILMEEDYSQRYEGFDPKNVESYIIFEFMSNDVMLGKSREFADYVQANFKRSTPLVDKGMKEAGFLVLRRTSMPSVLIELGFINNPKDAQYLSSNAGQQQIAKSIFKAVEKYKHELDKRQATHSTTSTQAQGDATGQIEYRVQVLASRTPIPTNSPQFRGLQPIGMFQENGWYKYTYGSTTSKNEINNKLKEVRERMPKSGAFIVKLRNGKPVK